MTQTVMLTNLSSLPSMNNNFLAILKIDKAFLFAEAASLAAKKTSTSCLKPNGTTINSQ